MANMIDKCSKFIDINFLSTTLKNGVITVQENFLVFMEFLTYSL